jgi:hypothetical protein
MQGLHQRQARVWALRLRLGGLSCTAHTQLLLVLLWWWWQWRLLLLLLLLMGRWCLQ